MSYEKLVESLKTKEKDQINDLWRNAKEEINIKEDKINNEIINLKIEIEEKTNLKKKIIQKEILSKTRHKIKKNKLESETELFNRILSLMIQSVSESYKKDKEKKYFNLLAKELPEINWNKIMVHPDDVETAKNIFTKSEIEKDQNIYGGLISINNEEKIEINNTLNKRIEKIKQQLIPLIIKELYKEIL
ncbi:MAG: V-type ATP synthase subunit E family protein [Spirochaetia bacterium]|nr:V-type ATP synthase subunit E family protein [Spirochaetia bacterium]